TMFLTLSLHDALPILEFVPVVPVNAPDKMWPKHAGEPPELDPLKLAELDDGPLMQQVLRPLVNAYDVWIKAQKMQGGTLVPGSRSEEHTSALQSRKNV